MITVEKYNKQQACEWNGFVAESKNGTFLLDRNFMDYHADRFTDASLVFRNSKNQVCGLLPANYSEETKTVTSHGGLTYGGLIINETATQQTVNEMLLKATEVYKEVLHVGKMVYKPIPYIYHTLPSQEDLYALFRMGAKLEYRSVSSTLVPAGHPVFRKGRKACISKARRMGLVVERVPNCDSGLLMRFHEILTTSLRLRHNVNPVHSYEEMKLLMQRFPDNIQLFVVKGNNDILAGGWVFVSKNVVHTQYLVNTEEGRCMGAEDLLLDFLIRKEFTSVNFFDFGVSTENNGLYLNERLISMKEGFGARSVCYDTYVLDLSVEGASGLS